MSPSSPISVNPAVLAWARAESGYPVARVARSVAVTEERIVQWERGERQPTLRQVQLLAHFFRRPFSVFFLATPPEVPPLAGEYRRLRGVTAGEESPEFRLAVRRMISTRENALNLMDELGEPIPTFDLHATLSESAASVGRRLRDALNIDISEQRKWDSSYHAWNAWRAAVERLGVLVFQFGKVSIDEARGFSVLHFPLPVAGVNAKELPEVKSYSLLHEVVHLMLAAEREELPALRERRSDSEWRIVERFVEEAASHALVPEDALREIARTPRQHVRWDVESVRALARKFRISPSAMATRLRTSQYMDWEQYREWRAAWDRYVKALPPRKGGFATPAEKAMNSSGRPFAQLVLEALESNRITSVEATRYLDLKFQHFGALRDALQERGDRRGAHA